MSKISELPFVETIDETGYLVGVQGGESVRFRADSFVPEAPTPPTITPAFTSLEDTPTSYTGQSGKLTSVKSDETGLEFVDPPSTLPTGGTEGQVLTKNSSTDGDASWQDASSVAGLVNLSSATEDYALSIGETAYVDFTAQTSVQLHIQTGQGMYEMCLDACASGDTSNCDVVLNPNNTTYTNAFTRGDLQISHAFADSGAHTPEGWHYQMPAMYVWSLGVASFIRLTICTKTVIKALLAHVSGIDSASHLTYLTSVHWTDRTTAWTSLGTLTWPYPKTGRAVVRRIS